MSMMMQNLPKKMILFLERIGNLQNISTGNLNKWIFFYIEILINIFVDVVLIFLYGGFHNEVSYK